MDKKQELIEKITKMIEPYENIDGYSFTVNLYIKNEQEFTPCDSIRISFNAPIGVTPHNYFID